MHSLFPELERVDQNTLFVIGNGFDLASGIKSSYYNFKQWLILNKRHQLINLMDIFFSNKRDVWKSHATLTPLAKQDCPPLATI